MCKAGDAPDIDRIIRTRRRTLALEVRDDSTVVARAPLKFPEHRIHEFARLKSRWIEKKRAQALRRMKEGPLARLDEGQIATHIERAAVAIPERVEHFARVMGLGYRSIRITNARKRLGSCGPKNSLNFTWRLVLMPAEILDYIVVHELAHVEIKNHSSVFWRRVAQVIPEFRARNKWIRENV